MDHEGQSMSASYEDQWLLGSSESKPKGVDNLSRSRGLSDPGNKEKKTVINSASIATSSKAIKRISGGIGAGGVGPSSGGVGSSPSSRVKPSTEGGLGKDKKQLTETISASPPKSSKRQSPGGNALFVQTAATTMMTSANSTGKKSMKEMTKAERRALQERQRAEKAARSSPNTAASKKAPQTNENVTPTPSEKAGSNTSGQFETIPVTKKSNVSGGISKGTNTASAPKEIHPAVLVLGLQFAEYKICGANARCIATLTAFKKVIQDYKTPNNTTLSRHLQTHLSAQINYLKNARPMSVSMGNAIRHIKWEISTIGYDSSDNEAKELLCKKIDDFIRDRITVSDQMIVEHGLQKIQDGDVILTYARSSVVQELLLKAHAKGIKFRVIVIDSRPRLEGKKLLKCLTEAGINCTYAFLHAVGFVLRDVSKVFLGAHAFMSNGTLYSRVGTALVAMMAKDNHIPVIVCCETYKFTDRVQLDSFVMNEQGNPNELVNISTSITSKPGQLAGWLQQPDLKLLNLMYDLTPSQYITTVITEIGMIPCTSVPVVSLRQDFKRVQVSAVLQGTYDFFVFINKLKRTKGASST
ncbi:1678_t:CDS:2 [Ambispora gerdemannii]|uniref:Translation initiation factor eIF2B subunit delta n=1 Tax=Ambispora gerdemannii TaxID=144530 RepID=A0A9N9C905_9GLOM|nr:1678_t:CDS:2 [Ambispora gerdemannii]